MIRGRIIHGYGLEDYNNSIQKVDFLRGGALKVSGVDAVKPLPTPNRTAYIYEINDARDLRALELYGFEFLDHFTGANGSIYFEILDGKLINVIRDPILIKYRAELLSEIEKGLGLWCPPVRKIASLGFKRGLRYPTAPISPLPKTGSFLSQYVTAMMKGSIKSAGSLDFNIIEGRGDNTAIIEFTGYDAENSVYQLLSILLDTSRYGCKGVSNIADNLWAAIPSELSDDVVLKYLKQGIENAFGYIDRRLLSPIVVEIEREGLHSPSMAKNIALMGAIGILLEFLYPIELAERFIVSVPSANGTVVESVPVMIIRNGHEMKLSLPEQASYIAYDAILKKSIEKDGPFDLEASRQTARSIMKNFCWNYGSMYAFPCNLLNTEIAPLLTDKFFVNMLEYVFGSKCNRAVVRSLKIYCKYGNRCTEQKAYEMFREMKSEVEIDPSEYTEGELKQTLSECAEKYVELFEDLMSSVDVFSNEDVKDMVAVFERDIFSAIKRTAEAIAGKEIKIERFEVSLKTPTIKDRISY